MHLNHSVIWLLLIMLSVVSFFCIERFHGTGVPFGEGLVVLIAVLTALKGVLVVWYFIELITAHRWLKSMALAWLGIVISLIMVFYTHPEFSVGLINSLS